MPGNQQPLVPGSLAPSIIRSPLVRSKSLRLPPPKPKPEQSTSTLTRHGSIRQTKAQSAARQIPFSTGRKPLIKPKPVFGSKSTENLSNTRVPHNIDSDSKRQGFVCRSPVKHAESFHLSKGVTFQNENYSTPSDSPNSFRSDRSQLSRDVSWSVPDLAVHLKRLTEEHEKLQVEYARVRLQLLDIPSGPINTLKRELQHLSHSDSHLASIPENLSGIVSDDKLQDTCLNHEALLQGHRAEILKLQEDNRKLQRKYWEQVLNSESIEDEVSGGTAQQVVDLIDKLEDKQRELLHVTNRNQVLENDLAGTTLELQQCQDALQDYQRMLEEANVQKDRFEKQLKEASAALADVRENVEFLQEERSTLAEALQEAEQSLSTALAEKKASDARVNEVTTNARKLFFKVQNKNSQIQLLQAELDRTQGQARDMLLSQGAELTMTSMHLSEISIALHSILNSASDFAANELELQKEVLEEIMADLDSDGEKTTSSGSPQLISPLDTCEPNFKLPSETDDISPRDFISEALVPDTHKSSGDLPSSPLHSWPTNGNENSSVSVVQSIIQAVEGANKNVSAKPSSLQVLTSSDESVSNSVSNSVETFGSTSSVAKVTCGRTGSYKPVGTAIPFRAVVPPNPEPSPILSTANNEEETRKASLESQLNQLNAVMGKLSKVIELTQGKYLIKITMLRDEVSKLRAEFDKCKENEKKVLCENKFKNSQLENLVSKLSDAASELKQVKIAFEEEKEVLLKELSEFKEQNKCLEAINKEQSRQLKEEVQEIVDSALKKNNSAHFSDAVAICDKLNLKQEIAKLKEKLSQKERLLQVLAQKFEKTKRVLNENLQKADSEVECLDKVIQNVYELLQGHPEVIQSSEVVKSIFSLVSSLPDEFQDVYRRGVTDV